MPQTSGQPKLHYEIDDFTDPWRKSQYIFLQHGFGRNARFWERWVPLLSRHYKVVRLDMRGFGQSRDGFSLDDGFRLADLSADVIRVVDAIGADSVHFVGEAFGGTLGIQVAAEYPDRIRTLSLLSAPVLLEANVQEVFAGGEASWGDFIRKHGPKAWAEKTNTVARFPASLGQPFLNWYATELGHTDRETLASFTELCRSYDQTRFLSEIRSPVFGVYSNSREEQVEALRKHVVNLTIEKIDTQYFMLFLIYPEVCAAAVAHFAAQHDGIALTA